MIAIRWFPRGSTSFFPLGGKARMWMNNRKLLLLSGNRDMGLEGKTWGWILSARGTPEHGAQWYYEMSRLVELPWGSLSLSLSLSHTHTHTHVCMHTQKHIYTFMYIECTHNEEDISLSENALSEIWKKMLKEPNSKKGAGNGLANSWLQARSFSSLQ